MHELRFPVRSGIPVRSAAGAALLALCLIGPACRPVQQSSNEATANDQPPPTHTGTTPPAGGPQDPTLHQPPPDATRITMEISYQITARSLGYRLELEDVRRVGNEIWTLASLTPPEGMAGMALEELEIRVTVDALPLPLRHFIIGSPNGVFEPPPNLTFIEHPEALPPAFHNAPSLSR